MSKNFLNTKIYWPKHTLLKQVVRHFWTMRSDHLIKFPYEILPGSNTNIIINYAPQRHEYKEYVLPRSCGLISAESQEYIRFDFNNKMDLLGIMLHSGAAYSLFNIPAKEFSGLIDLDAVQYGFAEMIVDKTAHLYSPKEKIEVIERELIKIVNSEKIPQKSMQYAVSFLNTENANIGDFCNQYGINQRKLERQFDRYIGLSPKRLYQVKRVQKAIITMITERNWDMTEVGYHCGYYDQSHFIREFKYFIGKTPKQFIDEAESSYTQGFNCRIYSADYIDPRSTKSTILTRETPRNSNRMKLNQKMQSIR